MINAPISTQGKARIKIWDACFRKTYQSELKELSKINGGKKISKIPRGSMPEVAFIESPTMPKLSENFPITILITKRVGAKGRKLHFFCKLFMTIAIVREKNKKKRISASVVI